MPATCFDELYGRSMGPACALATTKNCWLASAGSDCFASVTCSIHTCPDSAWSVIRITATNSENRFTFADGKTDCGDSVNPRTPVRPPGKYPALKYCTSD